MDRAVATYRDGVTVAALEKVPRQVELMVAAAQRQSDAIERLRGSLERWREAFWTGALVGGIAVALIVTALVALTSAVF